jgi:ABC-2 type transport system permease protein
MSGGSGSIATHLVQSRVAVGFFREEFFRALKSRQAALIIAAMIYSMIAMPFLLAKPHEELLTAIQSWFGESQLDLRFFLFVWFDLVMNKITVLCGAVFAAGIITDERSKGILDIFLSKPVTPRRYFLMKLAAAAAVVVVIYILAVLVGVVRFSQSVKGFDVRIFLLLASVHILVAVYAVVFAGTMAVFFRHKLSAMLTTILVLSILVGMAFLGFYDPRFQTASLLNPFYHAVVLIGSIDGIGLTDVVRPVLWLVGFKGLMWRQLWSVRAAPKELARRTEHVHRLREARSASRISPSSSCGSGGRSDQLDGDVVFVAEYARIYLQVFQESLRDGKLDGGHPLQ